MKGPKITGDVQVRINVGMQREGGHSVLVVTLRTVRLNAKNSTFCSHAVFTRMCSVRFSQFAD